uniref:Fatty acid-binding protein n=1 Tax=Parasteatoda tepidariorum TaxID=114398 RepID=A0A2L2YKN1_PARTP
MADNQGSFKLGSSDNFGEFLKEIGVNMGTRKLAETSKPTVENKIEGDDYSISTLPFKSSEIKFKRSEERREWKD